MPLPDNYAESQAEANADQRLENEMINATCQLRHSKKTDNILIGYSIGSADMPDGKLHVIGSGSTIRFTVDGHDGYVDLNLKDLAGRAYELLTGDD